MKMFLPIWISAGFIILAAGSGCSSDSEEKVNDGPQFFVNVELDEGLELSKGQYPTNTCIPMTLNAVGKDKADVVLEDDAKIDFSNTELNPSDDSYAKVEIFKDAACKSKIESTTLPAQNRQGKTTVYILSTTEGKSNLSLSWGSKGWTVRRFLPNVTFAHAPTE